MLIEEVSGARLSELRVDLDQPIPHSASERIAVLTDARLAGIPLQHLVGHWPFRYVDLLVDGRALIPRPETEVVVGVVLDELKLLRSRAIERGEHNKHMLRVVDLGAGSGAMTCSVANEDPDVEIIAVENSVAALGLASDNIARLSESERGRVTLLEGSWFGPLHEHELVPVDVVIANPPYLAAHEWADLDPVVRDHDPYRALVAGESGLEDLATIIGEAPRCFSGEGVLVCEIGSTQAQASRDLAVRAGASFVDVLSDLAGRDRVLVARFIHG